MDIAGDLHQSITVQSPSGSTGSHGDPSFAGQAQRTIAARVEPTTRYVRNAQGEEVLASYFVMASAVLGPFDRVWLPGFDASKPEQARRPIRIDAAVDLDASTTWWEVYF